MTFLCHRHTGLRWNRGSINFVRALAAAKCEFRRTDFCTCRTKSVPIGRHCLSDPFAEHVMSRYELPRLGVLRPERIAAKSGRRWLIVLTVASRCMMLQCRWCLKCSVNVERSMFAGSLYKTRS